MDGILPVGGGKPTLAEHTPLQLAVMGGHGPVVKALLTAKADPFAPARGGRQLIHLAALGKCEDLVDLLLDPDPEGGGRQKLDALSEHGWSALFLAAADDNLPMVKALLSAGAPLVMYSVAGHCFIMLHAVARRRLSVGWAKSVRHSYLLMV